MFDEGIGRIQTRLLVPDHFYFSDARSSFNASWLYKYDYRSASVKRLDNDQVFDLYSHQVV